MVYQWKINEHNIDPNIVGKEFERIEGENGFLSPSLIVESAKSFRSPLQKCFEWDDRIAGEKYREQQAGDMIRKLVIVNPTENPEKEEQMVRAYVNVILPDDRRSYISTIRAMTEVTFRDQVLKQAIGELRAFKKRYEDLMELAMVFKAIELVQV